MGEKELERFESASRMFQKSLESISQLSALSSEDAQSTSKSKKTSKTSSEKDSEVVKISSISTSSADYDILSRSESDLSFKKEDQSGIKKSSKTEKTDESSQVVDLLRQELMDRNAKMKKLENKCKANELKCEEKCKEVDDLKKQLEKQSKEFDLISVPIEGFGDSKVLHELNATRKQVDDAKWKCGELEAALTHKSREALALYDWKREAENTINRLQSEHASCNGRREKLEATVHALHQFALIMKKEAELAKQQAGIDPNLNLFLTHETRKSEQSNETLKRMEQDLDVARDNLYRQTEEMENYKWKCSELESNLRARDKELKLVIKEAFTKEKTFRNEIEQLKKELGSYPKSSKSTVEENYPPIIFHLEKDEELTPAYPSSLNVQQNVINQYKNYEKMNGKSSNDVPNFNVPPKSIMKPLRTASVSTTSDEGSIEKIEVATTTSENEIVVVAVVDQKEDHGREEGTSYSSILHSDDEQQQQQQEQQDQENHMMIRSILSLSSDATSFTTTDTEREEYDTVEEDNDDDYDDSKE